MRWQDALAANQFEVALDLLAMSVDEDSSASELVRADREQQLILTEFIISAVSARDERHLSGIRAKFGDPKEVLRARYDWLRTSLADSHPLVCEVRFADGLLLTLFRDYSQAVKHWESLYLDARDSPAFGENHPFTLRVQHELAYSLVYHKDVEQGVELFKDALGRWESRSLEAGREESRADTIVPRWRLAWAYLEWLNPETEQDGWKAELSEVGFREVIEDMKVILGDDAVVTLQATTGFSVLLSRIGKFEEAILLMKETYEKKCRSETLGPLSSSTLISLRALYQAEKELMRHERETGDPVAAAEAESSYCEHLFVALELQMKRVAFSELKNEKGGLSNYERCVEFTAFGPCLADCSEGIAENFAPERIRLLARALLELVEPTLDLKTQLVPTREQTVEYLKGHDSTEEGQRLVIELLR